MHFCITCKKKLKQSKSTSLAIKDEDVTVVYRGVTLFCPICGLTIFSVLTIGEVVDKINDDEVDFVFDEKVI